MNICDMFRDGFAEITENAINKDIRYSIFRRPARAARWHDIDIFGETDSRLLYQKVPPICEAR